MLKNLFLFNKECAWCGIWWLLPLLALLLGLWLAWILWGAFKKRLQTALDLKGGLNEKVGGLKSRLTGLRAERDALHARVPEVEADLAVTAEAPDLTVDLGMPDPEITAEAGITAGELEIEGASNDLSVEIGMPEADATAEVGFAAGEIDLDVDGMEPGKPGAGFVAAGAGIAALGGLALAGRGGDDDEEAPDLSSYEPALQTEFAGEDVRADGALGIVYGSRPAQVDDLTEIKGVGDITEERLNDYGVYRFKQICNWSDSNVNEFGERLEFPDRIEREEWRAQACKLAKQEEERANLEPEPEPERPDVGVYADLEGKYFGENVAVDAKYGLLFGGVAGCADDLTEIKGIGKVLSKTLNESGIYRFQQIADWNDYNVWAFNEKISFPGRIQRDEWVKQAAELAPNSKCLAGQAEAEAEAQAKAEEEARLAAEAEAKAKAEEEARLAAEADAKAKAEEEAAAAERAKVAAAAAAAAAVGATALAAFKDDKDAPEYDDQLGVLYGSKPSKVDDLTEIWGVGDATEKRLNDYGVYTYKQICNWDEDNISEFGSRLDFPDRIVTEDWKGQACKLARQEEERANLPEEPEPDMPEVDAYAGNESKYVGEDIRVDPKLNVLFNGDPNCADDLTEIKGIGKVLNRTLNNEGVYRFQQIADWDDYNVWSFNKIISFPGRIQRDEWIKQATEFAPNSKCLAAAEEAWPIVPTESEIRARAEELSGFRHGNGLNGDEKRDWILAERELYRERCEFVDGNARDDIRRHYYAGDNHDDLSQFSGIDQAGAEELNRLGFTTTTSLRDMSSADRERVTRWFDARGMKLDLPSTADIDAATASDEADYSDLIVSNFAGESVRSDGALGVIYNEKPETADDLTEISGVGDVIEGRLNDYGVFRFKQVANWDENNVSAFGERLEFPGRIDREEWIPQAQRLAEQADTVAEEEPEPETPDESGYAGLADQYAGEDVRTDAKLGILFNGAAGCADDLTDIKGIGKVLSAKLNESGVYRFQQIADWNDYNVWAFNRVISFPGRIQRDEWIAQAKDMAPNSKCLAGNSGAATEEVDAYAGLVSSDFSGEDVRTDQALGVIYNTIPADRDDLTEIKGVGDNLEDRLGDYGIFRFKQIANWDEKNVEGFNDRIEFPGRIEREEWVPQAKKLAASAEARRDAVDEAEPNEKPTEKSYDKALKQYPGEPVMVKTDLGVVFTSAPECQDDLAEISGIGKVLSAKLNSDGVYRWQQIADWNDYNVWAFNKQISFPGRIQREEWISQAAALAPTSTCIAAEGDSGATVTEDDLDTVISSEFEGEDVEKRAGFGIVYLSAPAIQDNLQDIWGVGPVIEKKLHDFGVYRFKQIANWTSKAVDEFSEQLAFKGRIEREAWIKQAKKLTNDSANDDKA